MMALGVDLGGTKIEAQIFDKDWSICATRRVATPGDYPSLVTAVADLVTWGDRTAGGILPVGIGAAGLVNPVDGRVLAANLAAHGHRFPTDLNTAIGRQVCYLNDCRALALSEAVFGAGKGHNIVASLVLGTGVSAGITVAGQLLSGPSQTGGELGHVGISASLVAQYDLPLLACGCGRTGCIETLISGAGLARLGEHITGIYRDGPALIAARATDQGAVTAWGLWCDLVADLLLMIIRTVDPDIIVLAGGLSMIPDMVDDVQRALARTQWDGFTVPDVIGAKGGETSGARGAAYAALQAGML